MSDLSRLNAGILMNEAKASTGLSDFGPDHFVEPLNVLLKAMRDEAQLTPEGITQQAGRLVNALENRLRRHKLLADHPEILDQNVDIGVVILGMPRTGSTMLQRLLASSPQATATRWWETIFPLPRTAGGADDRQERIADAEALAAQLVTSSAGFEAIHPMDAHAFDEELTLIEQSFVSNIPESMMFVPSYGEWLLKADQRPAYGELIDWLRILQWQNPGREQQRWILKSPHHLTAVQTVLDMFPKAVIAMTHRRIDHVLGSWYSMVASLTSGNTDADMSHEQAAHWTQRLRRNLQDMVAERAKREDRFVDVHYKKLLATPVETATAVFESAGFTVGSADRLAWSGWLGSNQRDSRPSHRYSVADFGQNDAALLQDFAFYTDNFNLGE
jgi:hypothetical protein